MLTRRDAMLAAGAACLVGAAPEPGLAGIRATLKGGRLGVAAINLASGRRLALDADARFAHCSVFKLPLVAAILARVDAGALLLDQRVRVAPADLLPYAPVVRAHVAEGALSLATLCEAAMTVSDNAAANLLLPLVGGTAGLTRWARRLGDVVTRFDRSEPSLNTNLPGDPRDTTSPAAMLALMREVLAGDALLPASRERLAGWMAACATGGRRLRGGFPAAWRAGDRTGSGERGAVNDVAVAWPTPGGPPLLVVAFVDAPAVDLAPAEAAIAAVGRLAARLVA
jgi:beta-lactamase class A